MESKCDGAEDDPGCQRLAKQLGATYLDMLGIMEERLPDMEHTVNNTRLSLEKRLAQRTRQQDDVVDLAGNAAGRQSRRKLQRHLQPCAVVPVCGSASDSNSITNWSHHPAARPISHWLYSHPTFISTWKRRANSLPERARKLPAPHSSNN